MTNTGALEKSQPASPQPNPYRFFIREPLDSYFRRITQPTLLRILIPLMVISYFGSLIFGVATFPGPFDWRTRSMSKLLYPSTNTRSHKIVSAGIGITGLLMLPFAACVARRVRINSPVTAAIGTLIFCAGAISLSLAGLIVWQPYHEPIARSAGICLGLGILAFYLCTLQEFSVPLNERRTPRRLFLAWSMTTPPALLLSILRLIAGAHFRWSSSLYRRLEDRSLWHLGFWEWISSGAVFLFLLAAALFLPEQIPDDI